jgi:hypothetical protein
MFALLSYGLCPSAWGDTPILKGDQMTDGELRRLIVIMADGHPVDLPFMMTFARRIIQSEKLRSANLVKKYHRGKVAKKTIEYIMKG